MYNNLGFLFITEVGNTIPDRKLFYKNKKGTKNNTKISILNFNTGTFHVVQEIYLFITSVILTGTVSGPCGRLGSDSRKKV